MTQSQPHLLPRELPHFDNRGMFMRLLDLSMNPFEVSQVNTSVTKGRGTTRGMHFLRGNHSEQKILSVVYGEIQDVVINVDFESTEFCRVYSFVLNPSSNSLLIPPKFAHGFQVITDLAVVAYTVDKPYVKEADSGISPYSEILRDTWKLPITLTSERDKQLPEFPDTDLFTNCPCC